MGGGSKVAFVSTDVTWRVRATPAGLGGGGGGYRLPPTYTYSTGDRPWVKCIVKN